MRTERLVGRIRIIGSAIPFGLLGAGAFCGFSAFSTYMSPNPWTTPGGQIALVVAPFIPFVSACRAFITYGEYGISENPRSELKDLRRRMLFKHFLACVGLVFPQAVVSLNPDVTRFVALASIFFILGVLFPSLFLDVAIIDRKCYENRREFLYKLGQLKNQGPKRKTTKIFRPRLPR